MNYSIALLIATFSALIYGLFSGNVELLIFAVIVSVLKYEEEYRR